MVQTLTKKISFDQFIETLGQETQRSELHDGVVIEMPKPRGKHSRLTGFLIEELIFNVAKMGKRGQWFIPRESIVRSIGGQSGYEPDIIVLDQMTLAAESHWESGSIIENAASVKLVVEVVSQNWRDDYFKKRADYEELGIAEYWIVDYAALGGRNFLGNPKVPTISIYQLVDGEYQCEQFRGDDEVVSLTFPELGLTAARIFAAAGVGSE